MNRRLDELRLTPCLTPHGRLWLAPSDDAPELEPALAERVRRSGHARSVRDPTGGGEVAAGGVMAMILAAGASVRYKRGIPQTAPRIDPYTSQG